MRQRLAKMWRWGSLFSGVVGLLILLKLVDGAAVATALTGANPLLLLPAALLVLAVTALRTRRWTFLFRQREVEIPFWRLLGTSLIGSFYGQFLPLSSAVGATLLFADATKHGAKTVDFIATVLVERVLNLVSLFVMASLVLLVAQPAGLPPALKLTVHVAAGSLLAGLLLLRWGWGGGGPGRQKLSQSVGTLSQALQGDLGQAGVVGRGLALSALVNLGVMGVSYLVTLAVAGPIPPLSFMVLAALIVTLQGIPITPGSLGIRESLYVFFLGILGVGEARAFTVGLLVLMLQWLQGFIGGWVLLERSLPQVDARQALARISAALLPRGGRVWGSARWLWSLSKRSGEAS